MSTPNRWILIISGALLTLAAVSGLTPQVSNQDTLILYGPSGPSPAINEAATAFAASHHVTIEIRSGPTEDWIDRAGRDADLVFSSAEFMMSEFLRTPSLQLIPASVTGLYVRPSVILVRPGNPKKVTDFPDLLRPGMAIMVVEGSGQKGLWEDMGGKLGSVQMLRSLRKNIAYFAPHSDDAMRTWKNRDDIDAWITWNIWYMPLRDRAELVNVSPDYRIFRQSSIALTHRGQAKTLASQFIEFLTSTEGEEIFTSWGWSPRDESLPALAVRTDISAVGRVEMDTRKKGVGEGLTRIRALLSDYEHAGITAEQLHIVALFDRPTAYWLLDDRAYLSVRPEDETNPNRDLIEELMELGVRLEVGVDVLEERGWASSDLVPGVVVIPAAGPRVIDLQLQGYAYIPF